MIIVYGKTGVGKTTLRRILVKQRTGHFVAQASSDGSLVPLASVSAVTPGKPGFDWDHFYERALLSMNEPIVDRWQRKTRWLSRSIRKNCRATGRMRYEND